MGNNQTSIQGQSADGGKFHLTAHESDSPILPVAQLERLHQFRPDLVDWVMDQTKAEAKHRWSRQSRVDWFILVERVAGLLLGFAIAAIGLGTSAYLAMHDHEAVASVLGGGTLVGIVTAFVTRKKPSSAEPPKPQTKKK